MEPARLCSSVITLGRKGGASNDFPIEKGMRERMFWTGGDVECTEGEERTRATCCVYTMPEYIRVPLLRVAAPTRNMLQSPNLRL